MSTNLKNHSMQSIFDLAAAWYCQNPEHHAQGPVKYYNKQLHVICDNTHENGPTVHFTDNKAVMISVSFQNKKINMLIRTNIKDAARLLTKGRKYLTTGTQLLTIQKGQEYAN